MDRFRSRIFEKKKKLDYFANTYPPELSNFPDGSDIEIYKQKSLIKLSKMSDKKEDKEHVTNFFWKNPNTFNVQILKSNNNYEIRKYSDRLAVEVTYSNQDSGFRYLFNYISGENTTSEKVSMTVPVTQSVKIDMTAPVTQSKKDGKLVMQFYLPSKFTLNNAPKPTNSRVSLVVLEGGIYAVIQYSGRVTDKNFQKHYK